MVVHFLIYKELLGLILKEINKWAEEQFQEYLGRLYKAMFAAAYYGLLRVGEPTLSPHGITVNNVHVGTNKKKLLFILKSSKTHNKGDKPQCIKIASAPIPSQKSGNNWDKTWFWPFKLLNDYIAIQPPATNCEEMFFVFSDNSPVQSFQLRAILRQMISRLNLEPKLYNVHSFRSGWCHDLMKYGVSVETIKKLGRWKSNAVFTYLQD